MINLQINSKKKFLTVLLFLLFLLFQREFTSTS
jgi:hypothetical protein